MMGFSNNWNCGNLNSRVMLFLLQAFFLIHIETNVLWVHGAPSVQVKLVNGTHLCAGRVEVYHNNKWGTVCDDGWGLEEAEVVCREIGCGSAVSAPGSAAFGQGTGTIWLDDVVCTPAAASIFNCMAKTLGNTNCGHGEDAGVMCSVPPDQVRLVNGPNQCSGRVEVYHSGEWGTVCDDDWGMEDAEVVCREIGCGSAVSAPGSAAFGQGTGMIWLDDVVCTPAAASIFNCMAKPWGNTNSGHGEDTGVVCSASFQSFSPSGVSAQTTVLNSVKAGSDVTLPVTIGTQFRGREESVTDGSELISIVFTTDSGSYTISNPTSPGETQTAKTLLWVNGEADIVCTDTTMTLSVLKSSIEGQHENRLRLNDPSCSISLNGTHIIASVSLNSCGTQIKVLYLLWASLRICLLAHGTDWNREQNSLSSIKLA
ncbi:deleted in malignant brain tumors 1 protein-like [Latimeria chalumnae]|uniref:deleted in malignant brain tumors 1 protein-like n=1 Tax=Latimeria chalumnae TaxID=7897 RepID=UPI00313DD6C5